jgi:hypothetical protein
MEMRASGNWQIILLVLREQVGGFPTLVMKSDEKCTRASHWKMPNKAKPVNGDVRTHFGCNGDVRKMKIAIAQPLTQAGMPVLQQGPSEVFRIVDDRIASNHETLPRNRFLLH